MIRPRAKREDESPRQAINAWSTDTRVIKIIVSGTESKVIRPRAKRDDESPRRAMKACSTHEFLDKTYLEESRRCFSIARSAMTNHGDEQAGMQ